MSSELKAKIALVLGAMLSVPVVQGVFDGRIPATTGAIRVAVGMVLAYVAVAVVTTVITGYLPKPVEPVPAPALPDGVEEAVLVEEQPPADAP